MYVKLVEKFLGCYVYFIPVCLALVLSSVFLLNRTREAIKVSGIINLMAELRIMNVLEKKALALSETGPVKYVLLCHQEIQ